MCHLRIRERLARIKTDEKVSDKCNRGLKIPLLHVINKQHKNTIKKMKRKEYETPTMLVIEMKQQCQILSGSGSSESSNTSRGNYVEIDVQEC